MTAHINAKKEDIMKNIIMPGDPLRAKYIAEKFLKDARLVNTTRNMFAYTGEYKNKKITIFSHGMGIPSMGIYSYELFKFYDAENIIRIGTCGANNENIKLLDVILATSSYSLSSFAALFDNFTGKELPSSSILNKIICDTKKSLNIDIKEGKIITSDVFDPYVDDLKNYESNYENFKDTLASEMESFALFYMAKKFNKNATTLLTVVDSPYDKREISSEKREKSLDDMIILALESIIKV